MALHCGRGLSVGTSGWSYPSWRPGFYPGRDAERRVPALLRRAPAVGRAEHDRLSAALRGAVRALGGADARTASASRSKLPQRALRSIGTFEERVRRLGDRLGPVRVGRREPRDDGLLALLLGSTDLRLALDFRHAELGRASTSPPPSASTTGTPTRRSATSASAIRPTTTRRSGELAARTAAAARATAIEVFAYFRHEDEPTAPGLRRSACGSSRSAKPIRLPLHSGR